MNARRSILAAVLGTAAAVVLALLGVELPFAIAWAMLVAVLLLLSGMRVPEVPASDAPEHPSGPRRRGSEISRMAWSFNPRTGAVGEMVTRRVRGVLRRRLARLGLDPDDHSQRSRVDALIRRDVWAGLTSGKTQRADIERALDAIDRLSPSAPSQSAPSQEER